MQCATYILEKYLDNVVFFVTTFQSEIKPEIIELFHKYFYSVKLGNVYAKIKWLLNRSDCVSVSVCGKNVMLTG